MLLLVQIHIKQTNSLGYIANNKLLKLSVKSALEAVRSFRIAIHISNTIYDLMICHRPKGDFVNKLLLVKHILIKNTFYSTFYHFLLFSSSHCHMRTKN